MEKEENSVELLKNFNKGDGHEATVELEPTSEEEEKIQTFTPVEEG
jgi:hypothetical protein